MKKYFIAFIALILSLGLTSCGEFKSIPAGYVGKTLTPTGWSKGIIEAGQVSLKDESVNGEKERLVLLEATSVSIKESYAKTTVDGKEVDNRIDIGSPTTVDVYIRVKAPSDEVLRDAIFAQITAEVINDRLSMIKLDSVYTRLAKMDVRSAIRQVLSKYSSVDSIRHHQDKVNDELGAAVLAMFKRSGVTLELQNVVISNIQEDAIVLESMNRQLAAQSEVATIDSIGAAIRRNPQYLTMKKYQTYEAVASKGATMVMIDGQDNGRVTIPLK